MTATDLVDRLANHRTVGAAPREELEWLAAHGARPATGSGRRALGEGPARRGPVRHSLGPHRALHRSRLRSAEARGVAGWRRDGHASVLPSRHGAGPVGRPGALRGPRRAPGADARSRAGVRRADDDLRPPDARSGAGIHVERAARREDDLARAAVGGPRPRAEQSRVGDRTERGAPREPARGRRAGGARSRRGGPDGRPVRRDRRRAQRVRGRARAGSAVADRARRTRGSHHRLARGPWPGHGGRRGARRNRREDRDARSSSPGAVNGPALNDALRWAAAGCSVRRLASEIQDAATRIAGLVLAVKGFTHMDQSIAAGPVDLAQGLGNTVAVLKSKARGKSVAVSVRVEPDLPRVRGFAGELNQIWGNLIDNALDAVPGVGPRRGRGRARSPGGSSSGSPTTGPEFPPRSATGSSIRSSRPSRRGWERGSASTSSAGSSSTTRDRSPSSRSRAARSFRSRCRSPKPRAEGRA